MGFHCLQTHKTKRQQEAAVTGPGSQARLGSEAVLRAPERQPVPLVSGAGSMRCLLFETLTLQSPPPPGARLLCSLQTPTRTLS